MAGTTLGTASPEARHGETGTQRGSPVRHEAINVEFNLLRAWCGERERRHLRFRRQLMVLGGTVALAGAILPPLFGALTNTSAQRRVAAAALHQAQLAFAESSSAASKTAPARERAAMRLENEARMDALLGDLATLLKAAKPLRIAQLSAEVADGKLTIKARISAPDPLTVRRFVAQSGVGAGVISSACTSLSRSDQPILGGVSGEYVRKSEVRR